MQFSPEATILLHPSNTSLIYLFVSRLPNSCVMVSKETTGAWGGRQSEKTHLLGQGFPWS